MITKKAETLIKTKLIITLKEKPSPDKRNKLTRISNISIQRASNCSQLWHQLLLNPLSLITGLQTSCWVFLVQDHLG
jgi:hypothetical protein